MKPGDILRVLPGMGDRATQSGNLIEDGDLVSLVRFSDNGRLVWFRRADKSQGSGYLTRFEVAEVAPYAEGDKVKITEAWSKFRKGQVFTVSSMFKSTNDEGWYAHFTEKLIDLPSHNLNVSRFEPYVMTEKQRCVPTGGPGTQLDKVLKLTLGQGSWTLGGIAAATGASEAAASARLRDLRAQGYTVTCAKEKGEKLRHYTVRSAPIALPA